MVYAISLGYAGTAAWLTAGIALAQYIIAICISGYYSLCKIDHSVNGITFEAAKANGFTEAADTVAY